MRARPLSSVDASFQTVDVSFPEHYIFRSQVEGWWGGEVPSPLLPPPPIGNIYPLGSKFKSNCTDILIFIRILKFFYGLPKNEEFVAKLGIFQGIFVYLQRFRLHLQNPASTVQDGVRMGSEGGMCAPPSRTPPPGSARMTAPPAGQRGGRRG
eukprot:300722-Prorocentrum_minimum.AAC.1